MSTRLEKIVRVNRTPCIDTPSFYTHLSQSFVAKEWKAITRKDKESSKSRYSANRQFKNLRLSLGVSPVCEVPSLPSQPYYATRSNLPHRLIFPLSELGGNAWNVTE